MMLKNSVIKQLVLNKFWIPACLRRQAYAGMTKWVIEFNKYWIAGHQPRLASLGGSPQ